MKNQIKKQETYRSSEFAKLLGINKCTLYKFQKKGLLPVRRHPSNNWFIFYLEDVQEFKNKINEFNEKYR